MATYQANVAPIGDTAAHYKSWAQFLGAGFSTLGWAAQTGHGEVVASGTGVSYAWTNVATNPLTAVLPGASYTFKGAWSGGTAYVGGNSVGTSTPDLVTNSGLTYECYSAGTAFVLTQVGVVGAVTTYTGTITGGGSNAYTGYTFVITGFGTGGNNVTITVTGSSTTTLVCVTSTQANETHAGTASSSTAPASDTINWQPFNYEIWKSNGPMSGSLPIYVRLVYTTAGSSSARMHLSVGTGVDANGNLTGTLPIGSSSPNGNPYIDNTTNSNSGTGECGVAGDSDNVRFYLWRDAPASAYFQLVVIDRAKTASGADSDSYFYFGRVTTTGGTASNCAGVKLNASLGGGMVSTNMVTNGYTGWPGVVSDGSNGNISGSSPTFGSLTPLPIFPLVGYLANPLLGCVGFGADFVLNGSLQSVWMYGASHNYLVCKPAVTSVFSLTALATHGVIPAILWE